MIGNGKLSRVIPCLLLAGACSSSDPPSASEPAAPKPQAREGARPDEPSAAEPGPRAAPGDDESSEEERPASPAEAKRRAIENARRAGALGVEGSAESAPEPQGWWSREEDPCPEGTALRKEENGPLFEFFCARPDGTRHGRFSSWNRLSRKVQTEGLYRDGKPHGKMTRFRDSGSKIMEVTYRDGRETGPVVIYYEGGQVSARGKLQDGKEQGTWVEFYDGGEKRSEGVYRRGKMRGTWKFWNRDGSTLAVVKVAPSGKVRSAIRYRDGERIEAGSLATPKTCEKLVEKYVEAAESSVLSSKADEGSVSRVRALCRVFTASEAECFLSARSPAGATDCSPLQR